MRGIPSNYLKHQSEKELKRNKGKRGKPGDLFLIICEGEKTEPNYFRSFNVKSAFIHGISSNTIDLVTETIKFKDDALRNNIKYDQVWCVFDKDDFPIRNFNDAITLATKHKIKTAYSVEAFELWYLIHFDHFCTAMSRIEYQDRLSKYLDEKYEKNSKTMYQKIKDKQLDAINNAEKLIKFHSSSSPGKNNPSTTVHLLVQELNKFI